MSGPGSPSGSPSGATGAGAEQVFAQLLLQLQQGQAQIARETREGLQKLAEGLQKSSTRLGIVDVKGIGKPDAISKVVMKKFRSNGSLGVTSLRRGFAANGLQVNKLLDYARRKGDDPVTDVDLLNHTLQDIDAIDAHLHVALVSLTQGVAYDVVYNSRKKCGLDAWRRLCVTYEPQNNSYKYQIVEENP